MALITCEECLKSISDRAPACPHCGNPRTAAAPASSHSPPPQQPTAAAAALAKTNRDSSFGRKAMFGVFGVFAIIVIAGKLGGQTEQPRSAPQSSAPTPQKEVVAASAQDLFDAYQSNEVATDLRLKGKIIQISGRIQSIDKSVFDSMYISLETSNQFMPTKVKPIKQDESKIAQLSRGQQVVFRCQSIHRWVGSPMGEDCLLYSW
ncbi:hypothetical protein J2R96_008377 [Bradyrhizobium elkanii]|nr:hypothetical protein [Bradyrhizobium elkanii]